MARSSGSVTEVALPGPVGGVLDELFEVGDAGAGVAEVEREAQHADAIDGAVLQLALVLDEFVEGLFDAVFMARSSTGRTPRRRTAGCSGAPAEASRGEEASRAAAARSTRRGAAPGRP